MDTTATTTLQLQLSLPASTSTSTSAIPQSRKQQVTDIIRRLGEMMAHPLGSSRTAAAGNVVALADDVELQRVLVDHVCDTRLASVQMYQSNNKMLTKKATLFKKKKPCTIRNKLKKRKKEREGKPSKS